jgi:glycolate dehydrogenase iron-sulfur subunit
MAEGQAEKSFGIFDAHHPPSMEAIEKCVHCGFCLPTCPTYALWQEEMDSPRGRIYLMKLGLEGKASIDAAYVSHFDLCLGCMACVTACPSGVEYDKLIEATRPQLERHYARPRPSRLRRRLFLSLFPDVARLRRALRLARFADRLGLLALARAAGLMDLLPESARGMEKLLPKIVARGLDWKFAERVPAEGAPRRRVGLLLGCVQQVMFGHVNAATVRVLAAEGCEVVIPPEQRCCGALLFHAGEEEPARAYARRLIDAFDRARVDTIVINAAGCGSTMKEYGSLLRDDPAYAERANAFAAKCRDLSELLAELAPRAPRHPLPLRVAYHDACHLQHAQKVRAQPRQLLQMIPGIELVEIAEGALCCGSAGIYNLVAPVPARELGDRKAGHCLATGAEVVATGNPGCMLQIEAGLARAGASLPVRHLVELLDASIRGLGKETFRDAGL